MNLLQKALCAGLVGSSMIFSGVAQASIVSDKVPLLTYAETRVPTYDKPGGPQKGFIAPNVSLVLVKEIKSDGWAYGSYTIAGGKRVYRWFRMTELQGYTDFKNYVMNIDDGQTVYRTVKSNGKIGSLPNSKEVLVVGESGNNLKVIYQLSNGQYKMGWISRPVEHNEDESDDNRSNGNIIYNVYGNVNAGSIDLSHNVDNSVNIDNSYNDYSQNDNSIYDYSQHNMVINNNVSTVKKGDINQDGMISVRDLDIMARCLKNIGNIVDKNAVSAMQIGKNEKNYSADNADMDGDGKLSKNDVILLVKNGGDVNKDGVFDQKDIGVMNSYLYNMPTDFNVKIVDFNYDGKLTNIDLMRAKLMLNNFFKGAMYNVL